MAKRTKATESVIELPQIVQLSPAQLEDLGAIQAQVTAAIGARDFMVRSIALSVVDAKTFAECVAAGTVQVDPNNGTITIGKAADDPDEVTG